MKKRHILNKIYKRKFRLEGDIEKINRQILSDENDDTVKAIKLDECMLLNELIDDLIENNND